MSISAGEENHELMKVLNRINTLMGQPVQQVAVADGDKIPKLTSLYEGETLAFIARSAEDFSVKVHDHDMDVVLPRSAEMPKAEVVESLLAEMLPVIQDIIKNNVLQEMQSLEQTLGAKLELEIMHSLRENLQSRLF